MRIALVPSSHGFGHAARTCAIAEALKRTVPEIRFEIFTEVPQWFFQDSLRSGFRYHRWQTDIGLAQSDALTEDLDLTCQRLDRWVPFSRSMVDSLARQFLELECDAVLADISPLALVGAERARLPAILVENFTWDWIYRSYGDRRLERFATYFEEIFERCDLRIQTTPCCQPRASARMVGPIARSSRLSRQTTRRQLGIPCEATLIFVTMGGIPWDFSSFPVSRFQHLFGPETWLVMAGARSASQTPKTIGTRVVALAHESPIFHPDIVRAADIVVGKVGYSTVAEVAASGCCFAYVGRPHFAESAVLESWIEQNLPARPLPASSLSDLSWIDRIAALGPCQQWTLPEDSEPKVDHATAAATLINEFLSSP